MRQLPVRAGTLMVLGAACVALVTAGCAGSPPTRFYTLSGAATSQHPGSAPFVIEVPAVRVPEQVRRPQMVIDVGTGRVALLEQQRWAAPLPAEIRQALSEDLSERLGTIDVYRTPHPSTRPLYQIDVNVLRFDSAPGKQASIDALWSIDAGAGPVMICRTKAVETVGEGYDALVQGHRRALGRIADDIAGALRALRAAQPEGAASCPAS